MSQGLFSSYTFSTSCSFSLALPNGYFSSSQPFHNRFSQSKLFVVGASSKKYERKKNISIPSLASPFHFHPTFTSTFVSSRREKSSIERETLCLPCFLSVFFFFLSSLLLRVSIIILKPNKYSPWRHLTSRPWFLYRRLHLFRRNKNNFTRGRTMMMIFVFIRF